MQIDKKVVEEASKYLEFIRDNPDRWDEGLDKYFSVVYIKKNTSDVYLSCYMGAHTFTFIAQDWQTGYDFFEKFTSLHNNSTEWKITNQKALLNTYIHIAEKIEKWKERKVKGQQGIRLTPSTLCNVCKHRTSYTTCKAFPSGIPSELHNKLHTEKLPSQNNDIVFELGEEGSKVANIKPIKDAKFLHCSYGNVQDVYYLADIAKGLIEEEYKE